MGVDRDLNFTDAAAIIKDAIVRSRYQAARRVNKELLSLYYGVGKYVSDNSCGGYWGQGAIYEISQNLQKELPGLRGFSEVSIKRMRLFFEGWQPVFTNRPLPMDELDAAQNTSIRPLSMGELGEAQNISKRPLPTDDFTTVEKLVFAVRDYAKPMGVATYRTRSEMPELWQKALPDVEDMRRLLSDASAEPE